jgi:hypothetical protein
MGTAQLNKNTVTGTAPIVRLVGDLPSGTPMAFEAAFGWGWLVRLLEDYCFDRPKTPEMGTPPSATCSAASSATSGTA